MNQEQIYALMDKFEESHLAELKIQSESFKITLKNPQAATCISMDGTMTTAPQPLIQSATPIAQEPLHNTADRPTPENTEIITSPIIGTFYCSSAPDAPAFVEVGSSVSTGDSLCIIEAMKIMNKLEADFTCEIVKILVGNGQMVEFNTPLFEVKRI